MFRLTLFVRLFSLTGITWIFEIVSWFIGGPDYYWYVPDAINSLRGVFVFVICCCKKEILFLLFKRPKLSSARTNGANTRTPHTSSTDIKTTSSLQMLSLNDLTEVSAEESA